MDTNKISVYCMPGLAASSLIFERIRLPESIFEIHLLDWELPISEDSLEAYAQRMSKKITAPNPVLIGLWRDFGARNGGFFESDESYHYFECEIQFRISPPNENCQNHEGL